MLAYTATPNGLNILIDGRMRIIPQNAVNFTRVNQLVKTIASLAEDEEKFRDAFMQNLRDALDIPSFIARVTAGRVSIGDSAVMFDGMPVHGVIADRLIELLRHGHDVRPLALFLERLMKNPTQTARDEMYLWLESGNLPLTADGCFLAFKKVNKDYSSSHMGPNGKKFFNHIGTSPSMKREDVDPNRDVTCSRGLHFCSWQYLPHFGLGGESRVVIVKIAPEDVVSIPSDYNNSKGRAWTYHIIGEVPESECEHLFNSKPVVNSFGLYDDTDSGEDCCDESCECDADDEGDFDEWNGYPEDEDELETEDEAPAPVAAPLTFKRGHKTYEADEILRLVGLMGQNGAARHLKMPRTTLQDWLRKIDNES